MTQYLRATYGLSLMAIYVVGLIIAFGTADWRWLSVPIVAWAMGVTQTPLIAMAFLIVPAVVFWPYTVMYWMLICNALGI